MPYERRETGSRWGPIAKNDQESEIDNDNEKGRETATQSRAEVVSVGLSLRSEYSSDARKAGDIPGRGESCGQQRSPSKWRKRPKKGSHWSWLTCRKPPGRPKRRGVWEC